MLNYFLQASLCLLASYFFFLFAFSKTKQFQWNRIFLIAASIGSLVLPLIPRGLFINTPSLVLPEIVVGGSVLELSTTFNEHSFLLVDLCQKLYLGIAFLLFLKLVIQLLIFIHFVLLNEGYWKDGVYCIDQKKYPTFSLFRVLVWNKENLSEQEQNQVWNHELTHIREGHSWDVLFIEMLHLVFWFHPIMPWYKKALTCQHEYIADQKVKRDSPLEWKEYLRLVVRLSQPKVSYPIGHPFSQSQLKNRIQMLNKKSISKQKNRYLLVLPFFISLITFISCTEAISSGYGSETEALIGTGDSEEIVYEEVEKMPEFKGGINEMFIFIANNIKYPKSAGGERVEGISYINFVVDKSGKVKDVRLKKGFDELCDAEALKVVNNMPEWTPGEHNGEKVSVEYILPIKFKLQDCEKE